MWTFRPYQESSWWTHTCLSSPICHLTSMFQRWVDIQRSFVAPDSVSPRSSSGIIYDGWDIVLDNSSDLSYALQSYLNCRGYLWGKHGAAFAEEQCPIIILLSILVFHNFWYTSFVNLQTKCVMFESKVVRKSFNTATDKCWILSIHSLRMKWSYGCKYELYT